MSVWLLCCWLDFGDSCWSAVFDEVSVDLIVLAVVLLVHHMKMGAKSLPAGRQALRGV